MNGDSSQHKIDIFANTIVPPIAYPRPVWGNITYKLIRNQFGITLAPEHQH